MSSGLEKPLTTGTSSTCRVGGGGGGGVGVVEPPLQPKQTSDTHKLSTAPLRHRAKCFPCIAPPQPGFSILPTGIILRRVILRRDLSTILGRAASKSVLWQNRKFIELIYGTPYNPGRRAACKSPEDGQEARSWWYREISWQRRTRAHFRRLPALGLSGSNSRSPRLVRTPETSRPGGTDRRSCGRSAPHLLRHDRR